MADMGAPARHPSKGAVHYRQAELFFEQQMIKLIAYKSLGSDHSHCLHEQDSNQVCDASGMCMKLLTSMWNPRESSDALHVR